MGERVLAVSVGFLLAHHMPDRKVVWISLRSAGEGGAPCICNLWHRCDPVWKLYTKINIFLHFRHLRPKSAENLWGRCQRYPNLLRHNRVQGLAGPRRQLHRPRVSGHFGRIGCWWEIGKILFRHASWIRKLFSCRIPTASSFPWFLWDSMPTPKMTSYALPTWLPSNTRKDAGHFWDF